VTALFQRLGNLGVLLLAGALLFGGLAGAAVVYHYDRLAADTVASQHDKDKSEPKPAKKKPHHPKQQTGPKQDQPGDQEND
jgi:hypothetical protein